MLEELARKDGLGGHGGISLEFGDGIVIVFGSIHDIAGVTGGRGGASGDRHGAGGPTLGGRRGRTPAAVDGDGQLAKHALDVCEAPLKVVNLALTIL